jgi:hypothetical protein
VKLKSTQGGWLPSLFPVADILGLADPLAAGQVTETQHGHSGPNNYNIRYAQLKNADI